MSTELVNERVNIYELPAVDLAHKGTEGTHITIGDLHGNTMKLMYMLFKHGIAQNLSGDDYKRLVEIYRTPTNDLSTELLTEFNAILNKIEFRSGSLIRLIGDELADRGSNDYFTLKVIEQLKKHKVPMEITVSNHSIEFIEAYEKQDNFHAPMLSQGGHAPSLERLQILVERNLVSREEIIDIVKKAYKPTLRAISYSLNLDTNEITIYSHAGIGLNSIKSLAEKMAVNYNDATVENLARTIDEINKQFQEHVKHNTIHTLYSREKMYEGYGGRTDLSDAPFEFILWNRFYHNIDRPDTHHNYHINFVHGHDSSEPTFNNIYNLDGNLGKNDSLNIGVYTVLYSQGGVALENTLLQAEEIEAADEQELAEEMERTVAFEQMISQKALAPTVITSTELQSYFSLCLEQIQSKARALQKRGETQAAECAQELHSDVSDYYHDLITNKIDTETFAARCYAAIDFARPELETHRGWKQVLGNLALAVVGLGVLYVMAGLINKATTGNFLFFKTDSANKVDQLEQAVNSIENPKP